MRIEDFPLVWRWTQSSHAVLPADVLALLTPLEGAQTDLLYRRGEEVFSGVAVTPVVEHHSEALEATRDWLRGLPVPANSRVLLVWSRGMGISLPWQLFVTYGDDFCAALRLRRTASTLGYYPMPYLTFTLLVACVLSVVYGVLAFAAYAQAKPEEKGKFFSSLLWMDPWWPYYSDRYLPTAQKKLFYGKLLFPILVALWVLWWYLQHEPSVA